MPICKCFEPSRDSVAFVKSEFVRIMVVGDPTAGRTSLIKKYVHDIQPKHHEITIGVNFELKTIKKEGKDVRLQIFDSGHQIYNELVRNIISNFSIEFIIMCVDLTNSDSFKIIQEWERRLEDLEIFDACRIVVCGTKADARNPVGAPHYDSVMSKSSKIINYFETSCVSGQNILEVFDFIVDFYWINKQDTVADKFVNE